MLLLANTNKNINSIIPGITQNFFVTQKTASATRYFITFWEVKKPLFKNNDQAAQELPQKDGVISV